jgi:F0F1-type ATP synthase assembly protein I
MADQPRRDNISPTALAVSMVSGALVGFIIWMVTDMFVFLPVFIGAGLTVGLAWGMRHQDEDV